jgi:hypothetical protein
MIKNKVLCTMALSLTGALIAPVAVAAPVAIGYVSYDVTGLGVAQFDITNQTGPNSSLDPTFPVITSVDLSSLSLDVQFASGPDEIFGPSYFTLSGDGLSWEGTPLSTGIAQPNGLSGAVDAILTGTFNETSLTLFDSSTLTIDPSFTTLLPAVQSPPFLSDGDFAVIYANPSSGPPPVPEPETFLMVGTGLAGLLNLRRRRVLEMIRNSFPSGLMGAGATVALLALLFAAPVVANAAVRLNSWTVPSSGAAGSTIVTLTGSNFPSGGIAPGNVTLSFASTCGGSVLATESPNTVVNIIGGSNRLTLLVPASLLTGTYFISLAGTSNSSIPFVSSNCSEINVTHTSTTLAACLPSSSLAVLTGTNVTAYVPKGAWCCGTTGVSVVPIEGAGVPAIIPTIGTVNSCSSNSATGETVCVDNSTDVYEITGSTLIHTLTSSSDATAGFSGGSCNNCGVAIDALTNTAVIAGGFSGASGDGLQLLNLATNTFSAPFPSSFSVSENVSIDPNRNLILSPDEGNNYDLFKINPDGSLTEYANFQSVGGEFDSAAEDCTTGIALSTQEFTSNLFITDLTQATFTPGSPYGTWTAPSQSVNLYPLGDFSFSAGTSGISVAAGTTHLGITMGEFGGNSFAAFQLPATSGTGTPGFVDYVGAYLPATPDSAGFSSGYDPHTMTAYTSPNNGKAYGLVADWSGGVNWVAVIDLQALLSAPRWVSDAHIVDPSVDLLGTGIVRYVPVP